MEENLWDSDLFVNKNIPYLFNHEIIEYDMREAGFNLIQEYKLLPERVINTMKRATKDARKIRIGQMERTNKELVAKKKEAFKEARKKFITANELEMQDIITIKKDAIFVSKRCDYTKFGEFIEFREKNYYTSFLSVGNLEIYCGPESYAVKGISDEKLINHEPYMMQFINDYCKKMETDSPERVISFTRRFIDKYKARELEMGYYLPFNRKSEFEFTEDENGKRVVDISYNFQNILLPLIKIPL